MITRKARELSRNTFEAERKVKSYFDAKSKTGLYTRHRIKNVSEHYREEIRLIKEHSKQIDRLLDIGCGSGRFLEALRKSKIVSHLYGIDVSRKMLESSVFRKDVNFCQADAFRLPFKTDFFDCVHMEMVLHHIIGSNRADSMRKANTVLSNVFQVLKPGGYLLLTEIYCESIGIPSLTSNMLFVILRLLDGLAIRNPFKSIPKGLVVCFYSRFELCKLISSHGGRVLKELVKPWRTGFKERLSAVREYGRITFLLQF